MQQRTGLNDEATNTTQDRADAETAQPSTPQFHPARDYSRVPEPWERDARKAGEQAAMSVRFQYEATMRAYETQRDSSQPAYWLKSHPCPSWCTNGDLHKSSDDPDDRAHDSDVLSVSFDTMPPSVAYAEFRAPEATVMLTQKFREAEPRIYINDSSDGTNLYATLDEAEKLAHDLLFLVAQARGGTSST